MLALSLAVHKCEVSPSCPHSVQGMSKGLSGFLGTSRPPQSWNSAWDLGSLCHELLPQTTPDAGGGLCEFQVFAPCILTLLLPAPPLLTASPLEFCAPTNHKVPEDIHWSRSARKHGPRQGAKQIQTGHHVSLIFFF